MLSEPHSQFGTNMAKKNGHEAWYLEFQEPTQGKNQKISDQRDRKSTEWILQEYSKSDWKGIIFYFMGKVTLIINQEPILFVVYRRIRSAIGKAEFISGLVSFIMLKSRWYKIIVVNVHARENVRAVILKTTFMKKYSDCSINSQCITIKSCQAILMQKQEQRMFSNRQWGTKAYIRRVIALKNFTVKKTFTNRNI